MGYTYLIHNKKYRVTTTSRGYNQILTIRLQIKQLLLLRNERRNMKVIIQGNMQVKLNRIAY